ncbi:DUF2628 domain-containing protein [Ferrovibrio xuzhouensis]|uniref:DUF2628 domain-containing protein n=1 Tax=Ferrovibrio xuzhouensis TaxID=1576914 RepID=A0ABV7VEZ4_9PROT
MRFFTLHERPGNGGDVIAVASGFSWAAALVPLLWLLWHRLWLGLAGYVVFSVALGLVTEFGGIADPAAALIALAVGFLIGCMAADFRRWTLARRGWRLAGVVLAGSAAEAEARWLHAPENRRAATARPAGAQPSPAAARPGPADSAFPRLV